MQAVTADNPGEMHAKMLSDGFRVIRVRVKGLGCRNFHTVCETTPHKMTPLGTHSCRDKARD